MVSTCENTHGVNLNIPVVAVYTHKVYFSQKVLKSFSANKMNTTSIGPLKKVNKEDKLEHKRNEAL